jgi:hypothetical protein
LNFSREYPIKRRPMDFEAWLKDTYKSNRRGGVSWRKITFLKTWISASIIFAKFFGQPRAKLAGQLMELLRPDMAWLFTDW